ncbi:DUF4386 domain-containing protein [Thiomicrorhabdus xiamenensis]|uniref:DUF4386 domain-containing protein n=1 Tax=Thiomicrorhabdus xiamenensis TaxID=2739063 RepID=A0A7D4TG20_9GAMM|nr:DUF4386 domain-containing protein [Thiomicrorhabdus xiamenensis]QKI89308.1 DUF4386 domain-containing protein [Thiomicrorhabdus xiamenensis]
MMPHAFHARLAGLLYLLIIFFGISSELMVRSALIVNGEAALTAENILEQQGLFRYGFFADSLMLFSDVALAVLLYILLKPVDALVSLMAMVFRLMQASILGLNLLFYFAVLMVLQTPGLNAFNNSEIQAIALFFSELHGYGYDLGLLFFAFSNFLLGYLLIKSDDFPSFLGYALLAAAVVYLLGSFSRFLFPEVHAVLLPLYLIPLIAELVFALWLLIKGPVVRA